MVLFGCGQSYEETKRISKAQRLKMAREDSAALKIAVLPTLDCLPLYLAKDHQMFDTAVDIRLKHFTAQMDIDTALTNNRVELGVTDLVRAERMMKQGVSIEYLTATNAYWQLVTNRIARITDLKHLDDKMLAMTRYSVTDLLGDLAADSAKLKSERVFRIQINDVHVRLKMLENNEILISATDEAVDHLAEIGYDPAMGARPVKRVIQREILNELSRQILEDKIKTSDTIIIDVIDGQFVFYNPESKR